MTFRASSVVPQNAYQQVKATAVQLKLNVTGIISTLAAGNATYDYLRGVYLTLKRAQDQFDALKVTPGLSNYAKAQENDPAYDVGAEFVAMQGAIGNAMSWMEANVPTSATIKPVASWDASGSLIQTEFTPVQTAGLRTVLSTVTAAIA